MEAADFWTQLIYAANASAELSVSAGEGCVVYYTTDGSIPTVDGDTAKTQIVSNGKITLDAPNNESTVTVKAIAVKNGKASDVTERTVQFVAIPELTSGTRVYLGEVTDGGVAGGPYRISVRVTTTNGKITRVEDNGTEDGLDWSEDGVYMDYAFWSGGDVMGTDGMPAKLNGKTLADLLNMKTVPDKDGYNTDAVSGATVWSDAIRHAAIAALRSEPVSSSESTVLAPTLSVTDPCVPNKDYKYIDVAMTAASDTTIRYTLDGTDPTAESTEAQKIVFWSDDIGVRLNADPTNYPGGQAVEVRAAAFAKDGTRSDVVRQVYVFANPLATAGYLSEPSGVSATVGGITVTAVTQSPNFDSHYYVTSLTLDTEHSIQYAAFLPDLLGRVYLAQTTEGVEPIAGYEKESKAVLAAVQAALDKVLTAALPTIVVSPESSGYDNAQEVTVTLNCPTDGAEIYYTVDNSNTLTGSTLSDPTKEGTKYTGTFTVSIDNAAGGKIYLRAAAKKNGKWSQIERKDLTFSAAVPGATE